jgi:hypothetical protein
MGSRQLSKQRSRRAALLRVWKGAQAPFHSFSFRLCKIRDSPDSSQTSVDIIVTRGPLNSDGPATPKSHI